MDSRAENKDKLPFNLTSDQTWLVSCLGSPCEFKDNLLAIN
ncbi:hypothetical protein DESME_07000 [Desulfitobacterium metallireducens DSM 15288]|uniref:Uncharacterized protein n=1 Tax=Desulfitobacterium metallireducens DSM 15288 TaxID=871968 RepID=W0EH36_9FIRM|nr:hypothetical protein DESME_07000 [Desulfitobacterium metallireducens DSM 15288]